MDTAQLFGTEKISKILFKLALPVMLAQLIQALYNIIDSLFEIIWTKVIQASGDMKTPMFAQIIGAVTNIILDPLLIFCMFDIPEMGIGGAAVATVTGQIIAALIVCGYSVGTYYKWQTFFFIPLGAMQTCYLL